MKFGLYIFGLMVWCFLAPTVTWFDYVAGEYVDVGLDLFIALLTLDLLWRGMKRNR